MAKKTRQPFRPRGGAKTADGDRTRLRRFLFLWAPIICVVLIGFYAATLDPSGPTGRTMGANLIEKDATPGGQPASTMYRIRLDTGEETTVFIPEKQVPRPGGRLVVEEYTTTLLKKKTYRYLHGAGGPTPSK